MSNMKLFDIQSLGTESKKVSKLKGILANLSSLSQVNLSELNKIFHDWLEYTFDH